MSCRASASGNRCSDGFRSDIEPHDRARQRDAERRSVALDAASAPTREKARDEARVVDHHDEHLALGVAVRRDPAATRRVVPVDERSELRLAEEAARPTDAAPPEMRRECR
jgi:hypothetical protein